MVEIGPVDVSSGERATGWLSIGESRIGQDVGLPITVINGAHSGDTLYIQAVSDGDELNGLGVVHRLVPQLRPEQIHGTIVVVGVANIHAFHAGEHRNPLDGSKLNRQYPGDEAGTVTERIAAATFQLAAKADLVLDLHQGSTARMIDETRVRCGRRHRLHEECLELAKVFSSDHVFDRKGPKGQLARVAPDEGIPAIDPELGGAVGWDEQSIQMGVEGVRNVLAYYGFSDGDISLADQTRARDFDTYTAPAGGLVRFDPHLGQTVEEGQRLFEVTDTFGKTKAEVTAETSGIFWRTRRLPQVASGEYACSVGVDIDSV